MEIRCKVCLDPAKATWLVNMAFKHRQRLVGMGSQGCWHELKTIAKDMREQSHAHVYILMIRRGMWYADTKKDGGGAKSKVVSYETTRRRKEIFKKQRKRIVDMATTLVKSHRALVWLYFTRNEQWYDFKPADADVSLSAVKHRDGSLKGCS